MTLHHEKSKFSANPVTSKTSSAIEDDTVKFQTIADPLPTQNSAKGNTFLGMINQLRKLSEHLASEREPVNLKK